MFVHQPHDNDGLHVYEFSDLDQLEGKDCLLVSLFARVPGRELFVNLLVIIVRKMAMDLCGGCSSDVDLFSIVLFQIIRGKGLQKRPVRLLRSHFFLLTQIYLSQSLRKRH